jgi:uncharacterized protein YxjI
MPVQPATTHVVTTTSLIPVLGLLVFSVPKTFKIQQKFFSLGGAMDVEDCDLNMRVFKVQPKILTLMDEVKIMDKNGVVLVTIRQKLGLLPKYTVFRGDKKGGEVLAEVKQSFKLIGSKFTARRPGQSNIVLKGKWHEYEFEMSDESTNAPIAKISKALFSWTDCYALRVLPGYDCALCLALCVIVDRVLHEGNNNAYGNNQRHGHHGGGANFGGVHISF